MFCAGLFSMCRSPASFFSNCVHLFWTEPIQALLLSVELKPESKSIRCTLQAELFFLLPATGPHFAKTDNFVQMHCIYPWLPQSTNFTIGVRASIQQSLLPLRIA